MMCPGRGNRQEQLTSHTGNQDQQSFGSHPITLLFRRTNFVAPNSRDLFQSSSSILRDPLSVFSINL